MEKRQFENWQKLTETGWFELLEDGRLALIADGVENIVDFHTHLGWTVLFAAKVDLNRSTPSVEHNFERNLAVDVDIYSGQNFYNERPKWGTQDYVPCALSRSKKKKHHTHTVPNLLSEMDALKIDKSVILSLDIASSDNSRRFGEAVLNEPRLVFFCCVHPKRKDRESLMEEFLALGAKGMKIHPEMQLSSPNSPEMISLVELWQEKSGGMPVLYHSGFNGFEPERAKKHAAIENCFAAAEALEGSPCILGHSAMNQFRTALEIAEKHPLVYLEIGGQPPAHVHEMLDRIGPDRLLYGSDWPIYPQAIPIAKVLIATEGNPEARRKILRDNAVKLLEMKLKS